MLPTCEWCGHEHDAAALCERRPRWSRRGFIALFGAGLAGAALGGGAGEGVLGAPGQWVVEAVMSDWRVVRIHDGRRLYAATCTLTAASADDLRRHLALFAARVQTPGE